MIAEFSADTTLVDEEITVLESMRENMARGFLEAGRDDQNRLIFRMTPEGISHVEKMGKQ